MNETFTLQVNDGEAEQVTLGANYNANFDKAYPERPIALSVNLVEGVNTITLTTGENYTFWLHSFAVSPTAVRIIAPTTSEITEYQISSWKITGGDISADRNAIGLNAFDNAADYGKTGFAEYEIFAEDEGDFTLGMYVMAGNDLANRARLTLNGETVEKNGKDYVSFDTAAGWGGDTWNYVDLHLNKGVNTLRIANCLTTVNAAKTQEVEAETDGSVQVSNWWMHTLSLTKKSSYSLVLDASNIELSVNPDLRPSAEEIKENLVVYLSVNGAQEETALSAEDYGVTVSGNTITVRYTGSDYEEVQAQTLSLRETFEGVAQRGKSVAFDGVQSTGLQSWYLNAAIKGEGTGDTEGRLFYVITGQPVAQGGYTFGSNGAGASENRQMTLTLRINNTGNAGTYLFRSFANANNFEYNDAQIKVNGGEYENVSINAPKQGDVQLPFVYEVDLVEGENTIELKLCEQYSVWFETFELVPIAYEADKVEFKVEDAARSGKGCFDTATGLFVANTFDRALKYYVGVETTGKYVFSLKVGTVSGKKLYVSIDGESQTELTTTGAAVLSFPCELEAGNHTVEIRFKSAESNVDFGGMEKEYLRSLQSLRVDTSEMELTLENGANPNFAKLKVYALYVGADEEELIETGYRVDASSLNNTQAGDYTITVVSTAFPEVQATFTLTVKAVKAVSSLKVDASAIAAVENGGSPDLSKLTVTLVYNDGTELRAMTNDYIVTEPEEFDNTKAGEYTFTVSYAQNTQITAMFTVTVNQAQKAGGWNPFVWAGIAAGLGIAITAFVVVMLCLKKKKNKKEL